MSRLVFFTLIWIASPLARALDGTPEIFDRVERSPARDMLTISEMIPDFSIENEDLTCQAYCSEKDGSMSECTDRFPTYEACVDEGEGQSCIWSCDQR